MDAPGDTLAGLSGLPRDTLVEHWQSLFDAYPPKGISRRLLVGAIAYEMQARRYGGLKPSARRRLEKIADGLADGNDIRITATPKVDPGTRLIREWNGTTHVVDVVAGGFVWNGERYRSLSAIARCITGARWSGPRFFGVD
jgi:hypothetical protein